MIHFVLMAHFQNSLRDAYHPLKSALDKALDKAKRPLKGGNMRLLVSVENVPSKQIIT